MKRKKLKNAHYIGIAFATVLFWRAIWHLMDRVPLLTDSALADIVTGLFGLGLLWALTRSFKHLD